MALAGPSVELGLRLELCSRPVLKYRETLTPNILSISVDTFFFLKQELIPEVSGESQAKGL